MAFEQLISQFTSENLASVATRKISTVFQENGEQRQQEFNTQAAGLYLDYAKQNILPDELQQLINLAETSKLASAIKAQFSGEQINNTERRSVLHTILRAPSIRKHAVLGNDAQQVIDTEAKMAEIVSGVQSGEITSVNDKPFTDVLAIGIGGSYYGVKVALSALVPFHAKHLNAHVLANVDGDAVQEKIAKLDAETTLVVVISKTFTTQETLLNAKAIKSWMIDAYGSEEIINTNWYAVSTNIEAATEFGINENNILPMWDWVGGRFSLWSAVGLPLALIIGNDNFIKLKRGAYEMDKHFTSAPFEQNMPVLMALLGIWNRNVLDYSSLAILPYNHALRALPGYLQQTDMESNGKSVNKNGELLSFATAPVVFGQEGTNGQHAFMQLMHQSLDIIPTDFIVSLAPTSKFVSNHEALIANCFAQSEALMLGKSLEQVQRELRASGMDETQVEQLAPHKVMKGNTPSNTLLMDELNPESLGALFALYEHKVFVQGQLWGVNSYDQWGVELGKELGKSVLSAMQSEEMLSSKLSASSMTLIKKYKQVVNKPSN